MPRVLGVSIFLWNQHREEEQGQCLLSNMVSIFFWNHRSRKLPPGVQMKDILFQYSFEITLWSQGLGVVSRCCSFQYSFEIICFRVPCRMETHGVMVSIFLWNHRRTGYESEDAYTWIKFQYSFEIIDLYQRWSSGCRGESEFQYSFEIIHSEMDYHW